MLWFTWCSFFIDFTCAAGVLRVSTKSAVDTMAVLDDKGQVARVSSLPPADQTALKPGQFCSVILVTYNALTASWLSLSTINLQMWWTYRKCTTVYTVGRAGSATVASIGRWRRKKDAFPNLSVFWKSPLRKRCLVGLSPTDLIFESLTVLCVYVWLEWQVCENVVVIVRWMYSEVPLYRIFEVYFLAFIREL